MPVPEENPDLHGNVPEKCAVALVLIDVINAFDYPGGEDLFRYALPAAERIAELKRRARALGIPVVYANDNFGRWQADRAHLVSHCLQDSMRGAPIVRLLRPRDDDYFVLKPKHSAFYSTTLDVLLDYLGAKTLILAGYAGDICVLLSASDAFLRDYHLIIPRDCVASQSAEENAHALTYAERVLTVDTTSAADLDLRALIRSNAREQRP